MEFIDVTSEPAASALYKRGSIGKITYDQIDFASGETLVEACSIPTDVERLGGVQFINTFENRTIELREKNKIFALLAELKEFEVMEREKWEWEWSLRWNHIVKTMDLNRKNLKRKRRSTRLRLRLE